MFRARRPTTWFAVWVVLAAVARPATAQEAAEDPGEAHIRIYKKVSPSVVFVRGGLHKGTGIVIDGDGYILTSISACGESTKEVTVQTAGRKKLAGKVAGRVSKMELVVVKISEKLPALELGESEKAKVGSVTYVFGDSYSSIEVDDQVAISVGVLSGLYEVKARNRGASYGGPVLETSCAVNPNQDGGPLVDSQGRVLGMITLNYDDSKFTGLAIPIDKLKPDIERIIKDDRAGVSKAEPEPEKPKAEAPARKGWLGVEISEGGDAEGLTVTKLYANGPAEKAGVVEGDVLLQVAGQEVQTLKQVSKILEKLGEGDSVVLRVRRDDKEVDVTVTLGRREDY